MILFDIVIDVVLYQDNSNIPWMAIRCPTHGPKPKIAVKTQQVQGGVCFQTRVTIGNLDVSQPDVRRITRVKITAGYRDGVSTELDCPVLSAYLASPMPNSEVVIMAVAVGTVHGLLTPFPINVYFRESTVSFGDMVTQLLAPLASQGTVIDISALKQHPDIMSRKVGIPTKTLCASNGLALVNWLNTQLDVISNKQVKLFIYNNKVVARSLLGDDITADKTSVSLDYVTDAKFTGTLLQVDAPWNPSVLPGTIIKMKGNFYAAEQAPNQLSENIYIAPDSLYTVILMNYTISTEGDCKMTLSALRTDSMPSKDFNMAEEIDTSTITTKDISKTIQSAASKQVVNIYFPTKATPISKLLALYNTSVLTGTIVVQMSKTTKNRDIVNALEKQLGKNAIVTVDKQMSDAIYQSAPEGKKFHAIIGYKVYAKHLYPYVYALTFKAHIKDPEGGNPISGTVPWSITRHWAGMDIVIPATATSATSNKQFWKDAQDFFTKYSNEWIVCGILGYSQGV